MGIRLRTEGPRWTGLIRIVDMRWVGCRDWDHNSALHFELLVLTDSPVGPDGLLWQGKHRPWCRVHTYGGQDVRNVAESIRTAVEGSNVQRHGRDPEGFPHAYYSAMAECFSRHFRGKFGEGYLKSECGPEDESLFLAFKDEWRRQSVLQGLRMSGILDNPDDDLVERVVREAVAGRVLIG